MPPTEPLYLFTDRLNSLRIGYAITGSVAGMIYGEPRLTQDVDIVLELAPDSAQRLCDLFPAEDFYCPPPEIVRIEALRPQRGHFNVIHHATGYKADIYLSGGDELQHWAIDSARPVELDGHMLRLAPPEYVIVRKLEYYREGRSEKHLRDVRGILKASAAILDRTLLDKKIAQLHLVSEWNAAIA
jgi:hypothetical protein